MKTTYEYLTVAHSNNLQWRKDLNFYKDEITLLKKMLEEVCAKNTSMPAMIMVSHFESQFFINKEVLDELQHEINLNEDTIADKMKENPIAFEHKKIETHGELKGKMFMYEKMFKQMKKEFNRFLSEVM